MSTLRTKDLSSVEMTRVCSSIAHPASPKSKGAQVVAQPLRMHEGGVIKRQPSSPAKSFKTVAKGMTKAECYAQLKNLLPNARNQEVTSEVCRVACKIHGWYSVRVQVLLCAVYILSYRFIILQLALVEETIAYIAYLEGILSANNEQVGSHYCPACMWLVNPGLWITVLHVNTRSPVAISAWDRAPVHLAEQQAFQTMIGIKTAVKYIHWSCMLAMVFKHDGMVFMNHLSLLPAGSLRFFSYCDAKEYVILSHWCE